MRLNEKASKDSLFAKKIRSSVRITFEEQQISELTFLLSPRPLMMRTATGFNFSTEISAHIYALKVSVRILFYLRSSVLWFCENTRTHIAQIYLWWQRSSKQPFPEIPVNTASIIVVQPINPIDVCIKITYRAWHKCLRTTLTRRYVLSSCMLVHFNYTGLPADRFDSMGSTKY